jgi:hypothetical protein
VKRTDAVVVSTLMEAWEVVRAGLVADSTIKDVSIYMEQKYGILMFADLVWPASRD